MPIVTKEVNTRDTPLRCLVDKHQALLDSWRTKLKDQLPDPDSWTKAPDPSRASIAGLAVDYRARWLLNGVDELPHGVKQGLGLCPDETAAAVVREFQQIQGLAAGPHDPATEQAIARAAVACATVEPLYRRGPLVTCPIDQLGWTAFLTEYQGVVDDAVQLSLVLPDLLGSEIGKHITAGPILSTGTLKADGDLMSDETLIELKCVSNPMSESAKTLRQLLVYAARSTARRVSLVLPRQRLRVDFDLSNHRNLLVSLNMQIVDAYARPADS